MEVTIVFPESWKDFVNSQVTAGAHGSAANYVKALVEEDLKCKTREHIETLLEEGLNSEDVEWTPELVAELKREVAEYHSQHTPNCP